MRGVGPVATRAPSRAGVTVTDVGGAPCRHAASVPTWKAESGTGFVNDMNIFNL